MENPDYSLVKKYFSDVPNIRSFFGRKLEEVFPDKIQLSKELESGIEKICKTFKIDDNRLITAIYWISYTIDSLSGIDSIDAIADGELSTNKEKFNLYDHFKKAGNLVFNDASIIIKAKGSKPPPSITISDPYLAGTFVEIIRDVIYMDSLFKDNVIKENRDILFPGKGKNATTQNWYRKTWIIQMLKLLEDNTKPVLSEARALLLISQVFYVNNHFFYTYIIKDNKVVDRTIKNVMDENFDIADIVQHLKRLIGSNLEPTG